MWKGNAKKLVWMLLNYKWKSAFTHCPQKQSIITAVMATTIIWVVKTWHLPHILHGLYCIFSVLVAVGRIYMQIHNSASEQPSNNWLVLKSFANRNFVSLFPLTPIVLSIAHNSLLRAEKQRTMYMIVMMYTDRSHFKCNWSMWRHGNPWYNMFGGIHNS